MTDNRELLDADGIAQRCEDETGVRPRVEERAGGGFRLFTDPAKAMDSLILEWYSNLLDQGAVAFTRESDNADPPFVDIPPRSSR